MKVQNPFRSESGRNNFRTRFGTWFLIPAALASLLCSSCMVPGQDFMRRQSLFGSPSSPEKSEPAAPAPLFGSRAPAQPRTRTQIGQMSQSDGAGDSAVAARSAPFNNANNAGPDSLRMRNDRYELTKIEGNVWRTNLNAAQVYSTLSRIVSQSYMVTQADRRNLNIQTDWDKFFIDGRLFRNRISVSVFPVGTRQTEVVLKNTIEYFSGQAGKADDMNAQAWLPSPDITDELPRIIDSLNRQTALLGNSNRTAR